MLVRTIMVIACDAANAERLSSGPSIPIHVDELSAVTKLLQVRVTENVSVPDDADTGQLAHPVFVKFRSLYSNFTGRHIGLWRKHGGSELSLVDNAKIIGPITVPIFIIIRWVPVLPAFSINGATIHCTSVPLGLYP